MSKNTITIEEMATRPDVWHVENKDPEKYYRHAEDNLLRIRQLQREGYQLESGEEVTPDERFAVADSGDSTVPDVPGHKLMSRPMDLHIKVVQARHDKFEAIHKHDEEEALEQANAALKRAKIPGRVVRMLEKLSKDDK